ncbi:hypothetical protein E2C01_078806 [Portunus trituberculatus]|uniref:Uncharacterized protein n=1 Tax=Portunus trituberculatus TaxID=210409 RepID=A0A5B7IHT6_PORTR|nr:hypothetical protein [Portunus trituberculatus]
MHIFIIDKSLMNLSGETPATTAENVTLLSAWSSVLKSTTRCYGSKN